MSNLHTAGLTSRPHSPGDHEPPADAAICWRCCPEFNLPTVTDEWTDGGEADLERIVERLRAL